MAVSAHDYRPVMTKAALVSLVEAMEKHHDRPGVSNRTKDLMLTAATVIVSLVDKVAELEKAVADTPRIVLP